MIALAVQKALPHFHLDIELTIPRHSFLGIMGPSGSGKSTLLRIVAGLERAQGRIEVDGTIWLDPKTFLPPQKRSIGFVVQEYALFPNLTVLGNLLYVEKNPSLARHLLEVVELWKLRDSYPKALSGGQRQRVALARALMRRPKLLLLDEPLAALDPRMRLKLQGEIRRLHEEFGTTTIMVSHDLAELQRLCDRIVTIDQGRIVQGGSLPFRLAALR
ncbi:MAG: ABC transporter ATP-binding protein [Nitratiruptor sp.]|nr:ABC transporter ATP-binding protein [Nitratiruptor sp.]NPA82888.1 ATP-binding cassette domain-containing protein [Campylobacterota bacterium]